ncbi:hypothetical protein [Marinactinospora rubrisoli]|uniref:Uncharacterized protein n=1 Tax=Marinactinospora rubrisoli TaxID=2715399 RepID=A0ABW2KKG5_9ACTN
MADRDGAGDRERRPADVPAAGTGGNSAGDASGTLIQIGSMRGDLRLATGDRSAAAEDAPPYWVPGPPRFVDRDDVLDEARAIVMDGPDVVTLLTLFGPSGIGTSALALRLMKVLRDEEAARFRGGFYRVAPGRDGIAESLSVFCRRLGHADEDIPATVERRSSLVRETLLGRGACAVLVDAPDSLAQIRHFVPTAAGSLVVVAGTRPFDPALDGDGEDGGGSAADVLTHIEPYEIPVGPLGGDDSVRLLSARARVPFATPADRRMAEDLAAAASGSPRTLVHLATRIRRAERDSPPGIAAVHEAVLGTRTGPAGTTRIAADPLDAVPARERDLARMLAWHPDAEFDGHLAAALAGGDRGAADRGLAALVDAEVLDVLDAGSTDTGPDRRYRFRDEHVMLALRAGTVGGDDLVTRILDHYLDLALAAHDVLLPGRWLHERVARPAAPPLPRMPFDSRAAAHARLGPQRATLKSVVGFAVRQGRFRAACRLCEALWAFWFVRGHFDDVVDTHTELIRAARSSELISPAEFSRIHVQRSIALRRDGERAAALADAMTAVELARAAGPGQPLALLTALEAVGDVHLESGEFPRAGAFFADALDVARGLTPPDERAELNEMRKLGQARLGEGRFEEARQWLGLAWEQVRSRPVPDLQNEARVRTALGELAERTGRLDEAVRHWDAAIDGLTRLGNHRRAADVHVLRADALGRRAPDQARADLERAFELYTAAEARRDARRVGERLAGLNGR